jgi:hypothetical protein
MQFALWSGCAAAVAIAGFSILADRKRSRRSDLDKVGFMPWPLILIFSMLIAAVAASLALQAR